MSSSSWAGVGVEDDGAAFVDIRGQRRGEEIKPQVSSTCDSFLLYHRMSKLLRTSVYSVSPFAYLVLSSSQLLYSSDPSVITDLVLHSTNHGGIFLQILKPLLA